MNVLDSCVVLYPRSYGTWGVRSLPVQQVLVGIIPALG